MTKSFEVMKSKPTKANKYIYLYNNASNGGLSKCITGNYTDSVCNILCNCVGWANARFNHIYSILTGYDGIKYPYLAVNAEDFIEAAKNYYGLQVGNVPKPGAIMCWKKGKLSNSSDGCGHVAIVEKVISDAEVLTSESGWNSSTPMWNQTRKKGTGNWGSGSDYEFRGFIYNPAVDNSTTVDDGSTTAKDAPTKIAITAPVARNTSVNQIQIKISDLNVRISYSTSYSSLGFAKPGYYNYSSTKIANGYTWYQIASNQWVAYNPSWATLYPKSDSNELKVGDIVRLEKDALVYGSDKKFSSWIYNSNLYVRSISGNRVVISILKTGDITGAVDIKYLSKK